MIATSMIGTPTRIDAIKPGVSIKRSSL